MSDKQKFFYFSLWNQVCVERGWYHLPQAEKNAKRHALHLQAGCKNADGTAKSSKEFTNADFDLYKAECQKHIAGIRHGGEPRVASDGTRRRLIWRIKDDARKAGLDAAYIVAVARDLHVLGNWEDLDLPALTNLRNTIHDRAGTKCGHDTRNIPHARPARHYTIDPNPRPFRPPVPSLPLVPSLPSDDNEPF